MLSVLVSALMARMILVLVLMLVLGTLLVLSVPLMFEMFSAGNTLKWFWRFWICFNRVREPSPEKGPTNEQQRTHYRQGLDSH